MRVSKAEVGRMSLLSPTAARRMSDLLVVISVVGIMVVGLGASASADTMATVSGTVTGAGSPVAGTHVVVYPSGSTATTIAETTTLADGSYAVSVPPGTWDFVFTPAAPYTPVTKPDYVVAGGQTLDIVLVQ